MEKNKIVSENILLEENTNNISPKMKSHVMKNFKKELKRVRWPAQKQQNKKFLYIFVLVLVLTALFALISFSATEIIKLIGAK